MIDFALPNDFGRGSPAAEASCNRKQIGQADACQSQAADAQHFPARNAAAQRASGPQDTEHSGLALCWSPAFRLPRLSTRHAKAWTPTWHQLPLIR